MNDIQLDGDPRRLATTIYRAALESYKQKHGDPQEEIDRLHGNLENEVPVLARQMVEAATAGHGSAVDGVGTCQPGWGSEG